MDGKNTIITKKSHLYGFDYLRVILCIGVIALHTNIFSVPNQYVGIDPANPWYYKLIVYNYFWCAVPTFYTLSLFLFFRHLRSEKAQSEYISKRLKKLTIIYIFWAIVDLVLLNRGDVLHVFANINFQQFVLLLMSNGTIAYFLFNLIYLTAGSAALHMFIGNSPLKTWKKIVLCILGILSLICMQNTTSIAANLTGSLEFSQQLSFNNPFLFFPYIFTAYLLNVIIENPKLIRPSAAIMLAGWIIFAIADYIMRVNGLFDMNNQNYESLGRISLVFESSLLVLIFYVLSTRIDKVPLMIQKMSEASMTVYITHTIIYNYILISFTTIGVELTGLSVFLLVFLISMLFAIVIKNVKGLI